MERMEEQMTAVELLQEKLGIKEIIGPEHSGLIRIFAEAKQVERDNICKAYEDGKRDAYRQDDVPTAEEYVYQKYGL